MAQFDRVYQYKALFKRKRAVSKQAILAELEISEATFKRDLEKMRDFYNYDIIYDRYENVYKLHNEGAAYELPGLVFSQKELLALLTIQNMITELEPGLLGPKLQPLQERMADLLASEGLDIASLTKRVRAVHAGKRRLGLKCFQALAQATLERKKVHVHHFNRQRGETTERDISPQQLVHYRDNWYVDAWCHLRNKLLNFSVDAIMQCDILPEAAKELSQKDIRIVMQSGYGIFGGEAHNWAKLKFSAVRARWVQAEEWHPEQKGTPSEDGSYPWSSPTRMSASCWATSCALVRMWKCWGRSRCAKVCNARLNNWPRCTRLTALELSSSSCSSRLAFVHWLGLASEAVVQAAWRSSTTSLAVAPIMILRGSFSSGMTFSSLMTSMPFTMSASRTTTVSAKVNWCVKSRVAIPLCRN